MGLVNKCKELIRSFICNCGKGGSAKKPEENESVALQDATLAEIPKRAPSRSRLEINRSSRPQNHQGEFRMSDESTRRETLGSYRGSFSKLAEIPGLKVHTPFQAKSTPEKA